MADEFYNLSNNPIYHEEILRILNSDEVNAEEVLNPVIQAILDNIHYLFLRADAGRKALAVRIRDPTKPVYGLDRGEDGTVPVALEAVPCTGEAEVSIVIGGVEYDAGNMRFSGDDVPEGTIIITKVEE